MDVDETVRKIEDVEIQGATAVAEAGISLLKDLYERGARQERIDEVAARLREARPTEPLLFNAIRVARETADFDAVLTHIRKGREQIASAAVDVVPEDGTVYTHCHSSTVTATLRRAWEEKEFTVRATETRPLYQGRTTARELAEAGIPVEFYVDAGAQIALEEVDVMCIGADALTSRGAAINKIGSGLFAAVADAHDIPVHVLADAWKYDLTAEPDLERRDPDEVWPDAPDEVDVVNYAFEPVDPEHIDSIITEQGAVAPESLQDLVADTYPSLSP